MTEFWWWIVGFALIAGVCWTSALIYISMNMSKWKEKR